MPSSTCSSCGKELTVADKLRTKKPGYCYDCSIAESPESREEPAEPEESRLRARGKEAVAQVIYKGPAGRRRQPTAVPAAGLRFRPAGFIIAGAALLAFIGSFLPWAEALGGLVKANGTDGDGVVTLVIALIGGALSLGVAFGQKQSTAVWAGVGTFVCGAIIGAIAAHDLNNLNNVIKEVESESLLFDPGLSAGSGLYLTLVAGIAMALSSVVAVLTAEE